MNVPDPRLMRRYLGILGLGARKPSRQALEEILRAHLYRIPFENLSKLFHKEVRRRTDLVEVDEYLEDVERFHFGGTCYALNRGLYQLLSLLGYDVRLCGADMAEPDVHVVVVAMLEGTEYLADVGYGGPFFEAIPLELSKRRVILMGNDRYEFFRDPAIARLRLAHYRGGEYKHGYSVNPRGRAVEEFREIVAASFREDATFMNALLLVRFTREGSEVLHNMRFLETRGGVTSTHLLRDKGEAAELAARRFGMPRSIVQELITRLPLRTDPYG